MPNSTVRLMHYDPRWRQEFQQTRSSVLQSGEGWVTGVEHIGSTAIPGLIARPIIDCVASVSGPDGIEPAARSIEGLNFRRVTSPTWASDELLLIKPRHGEATHTVLLTQSSSPVWNLAVAIREFLLDKPDHAVRFEEAKVWRGEVGRETRTNMSRQGHFLFALDRPNRSTAPRERRVKLYCDMLDAPIRFSCPRIVYGTQSPRSPRRRIEAGRFPIAKQRLAGCPCSAQACDRGQNLFARVRWHSHARSRVHGGMEGLSN